MLRRTLSQVLLAGLFILLVVTILGQAFGQPMLLSYVETGSMEPTLDTGDGFIAIPSALSPSPAEGDVVTFEAETIDDGGFTTHRIVEEQDGGYVTRGDANPFTDQDGGEPLVTDEDIVATALQFDGNVISIPYFGTVLMTAQSVLASLFIIIGGVLGIETTGTPQLLGVGLVVVGLLLFVWSSVRDRSGAPARSERRTQNESVLTDTRVLAVLLVLLVLIPANAAMVLPSGETEFIIDGDEVEETGDLSAGDSIPAEIDARNGGLISVTIVMDAADPDVSVEPRVISIGPGGTASAEVPVTAPEPGVDREVTVTEHRYLGILPESLILALHDTNPYLALGVLNFLIALAIVGIVGGFLGFKQVPYREKSRQLPVFIWIRKKL